MTITDRGRSVGGDDADVDIIDGEDEHEVLKRRCNGEGDDGDDSSGNVGDGAGVIWMMMMMMAVAAAQSGL